MKIHILALDGAFDTGLAVLQDVFGMANDLAARQALDALRFDVELVSFSREVKTARGALVPVSPAVRETPPDWVLLPAIAARDAASLETALAQAQVHAAGEHLCWAFGEGAKVGAACIGTFVLAESGLLDGRAATTTWWLSSFFRQRYPAVELDEVRMLVESTGVITAGAALGHTDLALHLVGAVSPLLADQTARYLIADSRPSQSAYAIAGHLASADPTVQAFEKWSRLRLKAGFSLDQAANDLAVSKRTLARRTNQVLGKSPLEFFQDLRVEMAVHLLSTTSLSVDRIAEHVGYCDAATLGGLLRKRIGKGPRELRRQVA
jgi:transcriptional regulator GlxA family with amidase domain